MGSAGLSTINSVAGQFLVNKPYVYSSNINSAQSSAMPNMVSLIGGKFITSVSEAPIALILCLISLKPGTANTVNVVSSGGLQLRTFAKNAAWDQNLYENLVEPGIKSGMLLETWQNGSGGVRTSPAPIHGLPLTRESRRCLLTASPRTHTTR